jgi:thiol-disulfide isomerase/thioredoxin
VKIVDSILLAVQVSSFVAVVWIALDLVQEHVIAVGGQAPEFTVATDDGRRISRDDFDGKLLLVNFWATWCPPCVHEMPSLNEFARNYRSRGVVVLAVSFDEEGRPYREFLQKLQPEFATTRAGGREMGSAFGTFKIPETYLLDRSGRVLRKYVDARDWMDPGIVRDVEGLLQ